MAPVPRALSSERSPDPRFLFRECFRRYCRRWYGCTLPDSIFPRALSAMCIRPNTRRWCPRREPARSSYRDTERHSFPRVPVPRPPDCTLWRTRRESQKVFPQLGNDVRIAGIVAVNLHIVGYQYRLAEVVFGNKEPDVSDGVLPLSVIYLNDVDAVSARNQTRGWVVRGQPLPAVCPSLRRRYSIGCSFLQRCRFRGVAFPELYSETALAGFRFFVWSC